MIRILETKLISDFVTGREGLRTIRVLQQMWYHYQLAISLVRILFSMRNYNILW